MLHRIRRTALSNGFNGLRASLRTPLPWLFTGALAMVGVVSSVGHRVFDAEAEREAVRRRERRLHATWNERGWVVLERSCEGVRFARATRPFTITLANGELKGLAAPDEATTRAVIDRVCLALRRYGDTCLRAIAFDGVVLASDLREGNLSIPSLPNVERALVLDATTRAAFVSRLVHHEAMHFLDWATDHRMEGDPAWERLNRPGFSYGAGGRSLRAGSMSTWSEVEPGFVTGYATSSVSEDKAELFALSMDEASLVRERAHRDPVLAAKLRALGPELGARCPELDAAIGALAPQ